MTLFEKMVARQIPADIVYEDDRCLAFHDVAPQAPTHLLVIPKKPIPSVSAIEDEDQLLSARLVREEDEVLVGTSAGRSIRSFSSG
jgi:histidine triad (HIT) family protein